MIGNVLLVVPGLQTPLPGHTVKALRQEVVKEQLLRSALPQSDDSQQANESVTDTSSDPVINPD